MNYNVDYQNSFKCDVHGPLQDDYACVDLRCDKQRNMKAKFVLPEASQSVGEVEVLCMVTGCFNKYDNINVNGEGTENTRTNVEEDEQVKDLGEQSVLPVQDNDNGNEGEELEMEGNFCNVNDPVGVDKEVLMQEVGISLMKEAPPTVSHLPSCYLFVVLLLEFPTVLWMSY